MAKMFQRYLSMEKHLEQSLKPKALEVTPPKIELTHLARTWEPPSSAQKKRIEFPILTKKLNCNYDFAPYKPWLRLNASANEETCKDHVQLGWLEVICKEFQRIIGQQTCNLTFEHPCISTANDRSPERCTLKRYYTSKALF